MKQRFSLRWLCATILLLCATQTWGYDFSAENDEGVLIYYNIISSSKLTCEVTCLYSNSSNEETYTGDVIVPESVTYSNKTYSIVTIGDYAFYHCSSLTEVIIPNSVTSIGDYAFYGCSGLTEITIPDSVTEIGNRAFSHCTNLSFFNVSEDNQYYCDKDGVLFSKDMTTLVQFPYASPLLPSYDIPDCVVTIGEYAFDACSGLVSVKIGNAVTTIGRDAFEYCKDLKGELKIPDSVIEIEYGAFDNCSSLTSLTLGNSVATIGGRAFHECWSLTGELKIPDSVTSVGDDAFYLCMDLTSLTLGNNVTTIGYEAFDGCSGLTGELKIPDSVITIGWSAFQYCISLRAVTIPNSVTKIENSTFQYCRSLKEIKIPDNVTELGSYAFYGCSGLTSVDLGNGVTSIGSSAFYDCTNLTQIVIPESVTRIGGWAFSAETSLGFIAVFSLNLEPPRCDNSTFTSADLDSSTLYVPKGSKEAYSTASVWKNFYKIMEILPMDELYEELLGEINSTNVSISEVWTTITTDFPDVVENFREEYNTIINELTKLLEQLYEYFENGTLDYDKAIQIRSELEEINKKIEDLVEEAIKANWSYDFFVDGIYYNILPTLDSMVEAMYVETDSPYSGMVIIPATVEYNGDTYTVSAIADTPFSYINGIESITIPSSISTIGQKSFSNCTNITNVICEWENPSNVSVSESSFQGVYHLATLCVPLGTTSAYQASALWNMFDDIEEYDVLDGSLKYSIKNGSAELMREQDTSLSGSVVVAENVVSNGVAYKVTSLAYQAFLNCDQIKSITLPNRVTNISSYAFRYCTGLESVNIPDGVTIIDQGVFDQCESISTFRIHDNITSVGWGSFSGCIALTELVIGSSVTNIYDWAFSHCSALQSITSLNPEPPIVESEDVFFEVDKTTCLLYVPKGAKEAYSSADVWRDFYNIEEKDFVTESLHNDLLNDIETVQETLEFSWNVITTDYSDVANEFESEYASLVEELKKLLEELEGAYNNGTLDETLAEEIRAKLEEIRQQIEELLEAAKNAHDALDVIESINIDSSMVQDIYTIDGKVVDAPQRGINIVKFSDGTTKKVLVK